MIASLRLAAIGLFVRDEDGSRLRLSKMGDRLTHWFNAKRDLALLASKRSSLFTTFSQGRDLALLASKGRDPFTAFFNEGRSFFFIEMSRALYSFFTGGGISLFLVSKGRAPLLMNSQLALRSILPLVPPFLRGVRGDLALTMTLNQTQQLPTNPLKTLQHINISKPNNFQSIPL